MLQPIILIQSLILGIYLKNENWNLKIENIVQCPWNNIRLGERILYSLTRQSHIDRYILKYSVCQDVF